MASKDKDYRLITLITDICPLPLRKFFLNLAQSDASPGVPFTTLDTYMKFRKLDVEKLVKLPPKSIRKDQFNLIYPNADETKWDVSLLSSLLLGLFGRQMLNGEDQLIKIIREIRNKRQHKPGNIVTEDSEFDTVWNDIETATLTLAQIVGGRTYGDEIRNHIEDVKINNLPSLGDTLKTWYEDIIVQLRSEIEELKDTSNRSLAILEATTVKRKSFSGKIVL
ncbi:uncharacterized protein LOC128548623 [Mercenaria mercenaria]|uniref:uncharacterized protein LOC128548623 n=1 Tax=Mercenaria mercenaria TaxID=6596 RepID=UPI00234E3F51|nr:uncharacterized protein LOC128548623 [Mercenaria mercenaria]